MSAQVVLTLTLPLLQFKDHALSSAGEYTVVTCAIDLIRFLARRCLGFVVVFSAVLPSWYRPATEYRLERSIGRVVHVVGHSICHLVALGKAYILFPDPGCAYATLTQVTSWGCLFLLHTSAEYFHRATLPYLEGSGVWYPLMVAFLFATAAAFSHLSEPLPPRANLTSRWIPVRCYLGSFPGRMWLPIVNMCVIAVTGTANEVSAQTPYPQLVGTKACHPFLNTSSSLPLAYGLCTCCAHSMLWVINDEDGRR